jgi:small-conductance mechanosensitive channel
MSQEDINKDLGSYIKERKDKPFWKKYNNIKIKPKQDEEIESAIKHEVEHVKIEEQRKLNPDDKHELEDIEKQVEEVDAVEEKVDETLNEEREGLLKKFFKKLNFSEKKEEEKQYEAAVMSNNPEITMNEEEMRELLHGLHNWIIQLPADKLERFKNSKEFELYTKYLRKHNLIK